MPCPQYECSGGTDPAAVPNCVNSRVTTTGGVAVDGMEVPVGQIANGGCRVRAGVLSVGRTSSGFNPVLTTTTGVAVALGVHQQTISSGSASSTLKKIPANSCHVFGCRSDNEWSVASDGSSSCLLNFALSQGEACFCDDACTQFRDCCEDYQATCL
jgi:hypothetical protein